MTYTLPFKCSSVHKLMIGIWTIMLWVALIGAPFLIVLGLYYNNNDSSTISVVMGIIFTFIFWVLRIVVWHDEGKIRCKCEDDD